MRKYDVAHLIEHLFSVPRATDFVVAITVCFYLGHLGHRFAALNAFCGDRLSFTAVGDGLDGWTADESTVLVECVRLLHADLSDLLRTLNRAYGPVLLAFFTFVLFDMMFYCFIILFAEETQMDTLPTIALDAQNVVLVGSVLGSATWVIEQVRNSSDLERRNRG